MKPNQRLYFIDAVRAFAILMMLQGHFIDTLLAPEFRSDDFIAYRIWSYFPDANQTRLSADWHGGYRRGPQESLRAHFWNWGDNEGQSSGFA